ncbi:TolC family protein [soil metagenome]
MKRNVMIVTRAAILLVAAPGVAQSLAPPRPAQVAPPVSERYVDPAGGLSLEQAIALALKQEPSLRAARTDVEAAIARRQQAALRANPTSTFERRIEPGGTDHQTSVGVQLPLELFRRGARIATAERDLAVSRHEIADRERQLAAVVRARYGDLLIAIRALTVLDQLLAATEQQLELVRARAKEGAAPPLERDLLDVEVRRLIADRSLETGRVEAALVHLKRIVGLAPTEPMAVRERLEAIVTRESASSAQSAAETDAALLTRPDVVAAEARIGAADARIRQSADEGRVDVSVFGTYMRMDAGFPQMGFASGGGLERVRGRFNYVAGGAMITLPLWNRNQGAVAAARAERAGAAAVRDAAVLQAQADLAAARTENAGTHDAVAQYRDDVQPRARHNLAVVGETFELGRATVFDVLAEQRRFLDGEKAFTEVLKAAFEARTRLQLALGDFR